MNTLHENRRINELEQKIDIICTNMRALVEMVERDIQLNGSPFDSVHGMPQEFYIQTMKILETIKSNMSALECRAPQLIKEIPE